MALPRVFVTNFNKNFTGVSATAAGVVAVQQGRIDMRLVGVALPDCPVPIRAKEALALCRGGGIWHVRRNPEMRVAIWARDVLKRPIKIVFTSAAQRRHSAYPRWLISKMDAIIATSDEAAAYVGNVWDVVPHGVATQRFLPAPDRGAAWAKLGYGGRFGVACVGRVRPEKGTDIFVETMLKTLPNHPDMTAIVVGKASRKHLDYQKKLQQKIDAAGLTDRLRFVGEIGADRMPDVMAGLSLLAALPRYEGYGMTPLEAMSCGVPFVGSRTGYFETFSDNGRTGTVVDIEDVEGAAQAVEAWVSDPKRIENAAKTVREFVIKNHSIEREVDGIHGVYQRLWDDASNV